MRKISSVLLLLVFSSVASAATVTIDFDGAQNPFDPITGFRVMTVPQGFTITSRNAFSTSTSALGCFTPLMLPDPNEPDNFYCAASAGGLEVNIVESGGSQFSLLQLDVYLIERAGNNFNPVGDELSFQAWDADDNLVAELLLKESEEGAGWHTIQFGSEWSGISRLAFNPQEDNLESGSFAYLDNVTVNVVPIPAAVWLFGSALLALGWARKAKG